MSSPVTAGFWISPQQKRTWTLQQEGRAFRSACLLHLQGEISQESFASSVKELAARHEILRTIYVHQAGLKFPFQAILDAPNPSVEFLDFTLLPEPKQAAQLNQLFREAQAVSSGPTEAPVFAATLVALDSNHYAVLISLPAMAADVASIEILAKELAGLLRGQAAKKEKEEPLRYVQFAQWQNDLINGDDENSLKGKQFWASIGEASGLSLPNELKSSTGHSERLVARTLDANLASEIAALAKRLNASESEVLLAAWQCVLWRLTHEKVFSVEVTFDGREYDELREAVGLIAKCLPIEARFDGDFNFRDVVDHVRGSMAKAGEWGEYYVPGSGFGTDQPVCFEWLQGRSDPNLASARIAVCNDTYKLKLTGRKCSSGLVLEFHYDAKRFDAGSVELVAGYFSRLLAGAIAAPESQVARLP